MKKVLSIIAVFLCSIIIVQSVPVAALADIISTEDDIVSLETASDDTAEEKELQATAYILGEITEERTENTKIFRMNDGSYTAAVYPTQVHYEKDGVMEEIDYSFEEVTVSGKDFFETKNGPVTLRVPQTIDDDSEVLFTSNGESISFTLSGIEDIEAEPTEKLEIDTTRLLKLKETIDFNMLPEEQFEEQYDKIKADADVLKMNITEAAEELDSIMMKVPGAVGSVGYGSVMDGIDLNYSISGRTLKEEIVLNRRATALKTFTFTLDCGDLVAVLCDDNSVSIRTEDGAEKFVIQAPFMYDALGAESTDIDVTLTASADGTYTYVLAPDKAWVASGARLYPIVIDPPVTESNFDTVKDTTAVVSSTLGNLNTASEKNYLKVGSRYDSSLGGNREVISMLYTNLPGSFNSTTNIVQASLTVVEYKGSTTFSTCPNDMQINAYMITNDWNTSNVMENNALCISSVEDVVDESNILDYIYFNDTTNPEGTVYSFDITEAAQKWHLGNNGCNNYGIALVASGQPSGTFARFIDSTNTANATDCPTFVFVYRNSVGIEDYWDFTSMTAGRFGSLGVNNNNGNLVMSHSLVSSTGNNMPVNISVTYSNNADHNNITTGLGDWRTNYHERIEWCGLEFKIYNEPTVTYDYCYVDSDGTRHYLEKKGNEHVDEDGLGLTMTVIDEQDYKFKIETKDHGIYKFDHFGRLKFKQDSNNNTNLVNFVSMTDYSDHCIKEIYEFNGSYNTNRKTSFSYSGNTVTISSPEGDSATLVFASESDKTLTEIRYKDSVPGLLDESDGITHFSYNTAGNPSAVYDGYGKATSVSYTTNGRVNSISYGTYEETSNGNSLVARTVSEPLQQYTFVYDYNHTAIYDIEGRKSTVQFNGFGHVLGIVDHTASLGQSFQRGAPASMNTEEGTENKLLLASKTIYASENRINGGGINLSTDVDKFIASAGVTKAYDSGNGNTGKGRMKLVKNSVTTSNCFVYQNPAGLAQGQYTISAYISTNGATLTGPGVRVAADVYTNNDYTTGTGSSLVTHTESGEWIRVQATVNVPAGATHILAGIFLSKDTIGTVYVDDIQLEHNLSGGAGSFNQLANASLINSLENWGGTGGFTSLNKGTDAPAGLKYVANTSGDPSGWKTLTQTVYLDGKKDDVFIAGAWGKANSVPVYPLSKDENGEIVQYDTEKHQKKGRPEFGLHVTFYNNETKVGDTFDFQFNSIVETWQFLSEKLIAPGDYTRIVFSFIYGFNTGSASVATPFLYKENYGQSYVYDEEGNVVSSKDKAETESAFAYQDNTLTESLSPTGSRYMYANDDTTQNTKYAISNSGQKVTFDYNASGDATVMSITSLDFIPSLVDENNQNLSNVECYIVNAKNGRVLQPHDDVNGNLIYAKYLEGETAEKWKLKYLSNHTYYIKSLALDGSGITTDSSGTLLKLETVTYNSSWVPPVSFKFRFESNGDGTFKIAVGSSNNSKYLYQTDGLHYSGSNSYSVRMAEYEENDPAFKWYLVAVTNDLPKMQTTATYDGDGTHLKASTDADGNVTSYDYGQNGLISTTTDALGHKTKYTYDAMNNTKSVINVPKNESDSNYTSKVEYEYEDDLLTSVAIDDNEVVYNFTYDDYDRNLTTSIGENLFISNTYTGRDLSKQTYANGDYTNFYYDNLDRLIKQTYNENDEQDKYVQYFYDPNGNLYRTKDTLWGKQTVFDYDLAGRVNVVSVFDTGTMILRALETIRYNDGKGTVKSMTHSIFNASGSLLKTLEYNYTYGDPAKGEIPDTLYKYEVGTAIDYTFSYDDLGRLTDKNLKTSNINKTESYTYKVSDRGTNWTTPLVWKMTDFAGVLHEYEYDKNGNITSDTYGGHTVSYKYDSLNRMTRYNDPVYGWTCVYVYDDRGNIIEMQEYEYTTAETLGEPLYTYEYEYGDSTWADLLTSYYGADITYDELGNPTKWINGETLSWQNGRQLASYDGSVNYTYNADGLRTGKSGDKNTEYYIVNGTYLGETTTINGTTYNLSYFYDENGSIAGLWLGEGVYYFAKNTQGDVTAILDYQGNVVANYRYDAYGYIISVTDANGNYISSATHIANLNPFRYRGYMYDEESGFYYLRSRYYDPYIGRFINADSTGLVTANPTSAKYDKNLFAYCDNNPVNRADDGGDFWHIVAGAAIGAGVSFVSSIVTDIVTGKEVNLAAAGFSAIGGAISGTLTACGLPVAAVAVDGVFGAATSVIGNAEEYKNGEITTGELVAEALIDGSVSAAFSAVGIDSSGKTLNTSFKSAMAANKYASIVKTPAAKKAARTSFSAYKRQAKNYFMDTLKSSPFNSFSVFTIQSAVKGKCGLRD